MSDKILDSNHIRLDKIPSLDNKGEPGNSAHFGKGKTFTTTKFVLFHASINKIPS